MKSTPDLGSENQHGTCVWSAVTEATHELDTILKKTGRCPNTTETKTRGGHKGISPFIFASPLCPI